MVDRELQQRIHKIYKLATEIEYHVRQQKQITNSSSGTKVAQSSADKNKSSQKIGTSQAANTIRLERPDIVQLFPLRGSISGRRFALRAVTVCIIGFIVFGILWSAL